MSFLADSLGQARFVLGLPAFFRRRISLEEARATVRGRLADREGLFRRSARTAIFDNPDSPYLWLLKRHGIGAPDLDVMLRRDGLDATLTSLQRAGVSVSFEEFKGRVPIVRDGAEFPVDARSFDHPVRGIGFHGTTGGSTGRPTRLGIDLDNLVDQSPNILLAFDAHGLRDCPTAMWYTILPAVAGINSVLRSVTIGHVPERWFSPLGADELSAPLKDRVATALIVRAGRLAGAPLPAPEYVPFDRAIVVARWAERAVARRRTAIIRGHVSALARVALAAEEAGIDLTGTVLWGGGEPPTATKVAAMTRAGATFLPTYYLSEAGAIGFPCCNPLDSTDVHFMADCLALVAEGPSNPEAAQQFWLTTLLPTAPKVMFNVETDDQGIVETRSCGCPLAGEGYGTHIRQVQSARKLTSEGMRILNIDALALVEEFLPATFGGSAMHYQIAEEEDAAARTRVAIVIDPSIQVADDETVIRAVLGFLRARGERLAASTWSQASTLSVRRETPRWSPQGKLPPLRKVREPSGEMRA